MVTGPRLESSQYVIQKDLNIVSQQSLCLQAAEKGNLAEFQRLLAADDRRLQFRDSRGRQAIHHAALNDRINILEYILSLPGADLRPVDNEGKLFSRSIGLRVRA